MFAVSARRNADAAGQMVVLLSELAEFLQTTPSSLQRELKALVDSGILQQRREGTRIYFKAETQSPLFPELRGLLEKTAGLLPTLQRRWSHLRTGSTALLFMVPWHAVRNMREATSTCW